MCFLEKVILEISENSKENTGKHPSLILNKVAGFRLWHRCFLCEFSEISKNTFSLYRTPSMGASDLNKR